MNNPGMMGMTPGMAPATMPCNMAMLPPQGGLTPPGPPAPAGPPAPGPGPGRPKVAKRDNRSSAEIKEELLKLGIDTKGVVATRDMLLKLHETEAFVRRAEATKKLSRHPEQNLLSCFTEGLAPGSEALLGIARQHFATSKSFPTVLFFYVLLK